MRESINFNTRVIEKCLQGDIKAQYQLYQQYSNAMYNIASRLMNNKMDAEDILQDSFVTAFQHLGELENKEVFGSWLKRIVINKCISQLRKKKIHFEEVDESRVEQEYMEEETWHEIDPSVVHHAVKELPDKGRAVLVLRALEGYKHKEISEMLDISVSTSKTQYSRALPLLKKNVKRKVYVD